MQDPATTSMMEVPEDHSCSDQSGEYAAAWGTDTIQEQQQQETVLYTTTSSGGTRTLSATSGRFVTLPQRGQAPAPNPPLQPNHQQPQQLVAGGLQKKALMAAASQQTAYAAVLENNGDLGHSDMGVTVGLSSSIETGSADSQPFFLTSAASPGPNMNASDPSGPEIFHS